MRRRIYIRREDYIEILDTLREPERIALLLGERRGGRWVVVEVLIPPGEAVERSLAHVRVDGEWLAPKLLEARMKGLDLVAVFHSHLASEEPSQGDLETHEKVVASYPDCLMGIYSLSRGRLRVYSLPGMEYVKIRIVDLARFDRQLRVLGVRGQMLLSSSTVALVGVGGASILAEMLAASGVGRLIIVDPDRWEYHNRNRVLVPRSHVGWSKVESLKSIIEDYYPDVEVEAHEARVQDLPDSVFEDADVVVCGADSLLARIHVNRLALRLRKPAVFISAGVEVGEGRVVMTGQVQVVQPYATACYECLPVDVDELRREMMGEEDRRRLAEYLRSTGRLDELEKLEGRVVPSFAFLNMVVAGLALHEVVKLLTGIGEPARGLLVYDPLANALTVYELDRNPHCPACSDAEEVGVVESYELETVGKEEVLGFKSVREPGGGVSG